MKKFLSVIALLLALVILFCACDSTTDSKDPVESESESSADSESLNNEPKTIYGIWYSEDNQTVLDLTDLESVEYYQLMVGFYQYQKTVTLSATYEDYILTLETEDGKKLTWIFDAQKGSLSANNGGDTSAYVKKDALPTEYVSLKFPDFSKIDCEIEIKSEDYLSIELSEKAPLYAATEVFVKLYGTAKDKEPKKITDRKSQAGDYVNVDYTGKLDNVAFEGGTAKGADILIDSDSGYIPGFAEGIAGHTVGETFDVPVKFPDEYHSKELAGKNVIFTMTLNAIYDLHISDEDVAELTDNAYTSYDTLLNEAIEDLYISQIGEALLEMATYEKMPEEAYAFFIQYYEEMYRYYAYYYQMEYEALLEIYGLTPQTLLLEAQKTALPYLTAYTIAKAHNLSVSDADFQEAYQQYVQDLMETQKVTQAEAEAMVEESGTASIYAELTYNMVLKWLVQQNQSA